MKGFESHITTDRQVAATGMAINPLRLMAVAALAMHGTGVDQ